MAIDGESAARRLRRARRVLGYVAAQELSKAIPNTVTPSIIISTENHVTRLTIGYLLDAAMVLGISPLALLADLFEPSGTVDIPGVGRDVARLTNEQFVLWFIGAIAMEPKPSEAEKDPEHAEKIREERRIYRDALSVTIDLANARTWLTAARSAVPAGTSPLDEQIVQLEAEIQQLEQAARSLGIVLSGPNWARRAGRH